MNIPINPDHILTLTDAEIAEYRLQAKAGFDLQLRSNDGWITLSPADLLRLLGDD